MAYSQKDHYAQDSQNSVLYHKQQHANQNAVIQPTESNLASGA